MVERNGHYPDHHQDREPHREISPAQRLHLDLIRLASFHKFDGEQVARDLEAHRGWWQAAMMGNFISGYHLLSLRDLPEGHNNVDTLMLLTTADKRRPLEKLASRWHADTLRWLTENEASEELGVHPAGDRWVLEVWWG